MKTKSPRSHRNRVLIISERFFPEEFIVNELVLELKKRGLECDVLTQVPSYPFGKVSAYPGYKNRLFSIGFWNDLKIYRIMTIQGYRESRFRKVLNYLNFAVVCSIVLLFIGWKYKKIFVYHSGPLTVATPAIIGKKIFRTTNIIWSVDLWPDTIYMYGYRKSRMNTAILDRFVRTIYHQFDSVFCSSPAFVPKLMNYVKSAPVKALLQWPQIVSDNAPSDEIILEKGKIHFTFTGNIAWTQNLENVILGFSEAQKDHPSIILNIFGDGSNLEHLKKMTKDGGIENIIFWGRRPLQEMPAIYDQSHVLLLSLQPDPVYELYIPLKFSTYLAFGKPIFAIINGVVSDLVSKNRLGIVSDPSKPDEIRKGFSQFARMTPDQMEEFGRNSSALIKNEFDKERTIGILFDALT